MVIRGLDGERVLDMHDFHRGPHRTAVADDELLGGPPSEERLDAAGHAAAAGANPVSDQRGSAE